MKLLDIEALDIHWILPARYLASPKAKAGGDIKKLGIK